MAMNGMPGCEGCEHFNEVWLDEDKSNGHRHRRYCGLGNFNIDKASFIPKATSHNKLKYEQQDMHPDYLEFSRPARCPLKTAEERKKQTKWYKERR